MPHMSSPYSSVGKTRLRAYAGLLFVNIIVLALSARVNLFQEFFFMADLFPLGLSITTFILLVIMLLLDFSHHNAFTAQPPFEIGILTVLTIFWLAFNSFSTVRWRHVPLACNSIPAEFSDEKTWCRDLQALKAFVWIEWVVLLFTVLFTIRYVAKEHTRGNKHVWATALSRYTPYFSGPQMDENFHRGTLHQRTSSFWNGETSRR